ncbi:MAG TPA: carboxypeptidase regulatory-like domain-containing protein [Candidatus Acidoferrales bacterium]|nr:carboxypeptidase regulatory-like domain-containing protein [Candidatus Acidoferrales bacterium]
MRFKLFSAVSGVILVFAVALCFALPSFAQNATATTGAVRGQVTDPSGAALVGASVLVTGPDGQTLTATTGKNGAYEVKGLAPGKYKVEALAKGFAVFEQDDVQVTAGEAEKLEITLAIETQQERVVVSSEAETLSVAPESNAGAIIISGKELDALSNDPDELQSDLQALAGPSAGPNGGQMYIDGFTAGQLPPKSSIREIRINQNPFSAEYDKLGYGRIEIFTKPGTDQFHGEVSAMGNDSALNTRSPFLGTATQPGYYSDMLEANVGGPLSKKASFFLFAQHRNINDLSIIDAAAPPAYVAGDFQQAIPNTHGRTNVGPRLDYQLGKNDTLTLRYQYWRNDEKNQGIGAFTLPTQAYNTLETEQTLQAGETHLFGSNIVNETRFQFVRDVTNQTPTSTLPTINVEGFFTAGGNSQGTVQDNENRYELQNYTSIVHGKHMIKFGARLRQSSLTDDSTSQFNSTYIFKTSAAYQTTLDNIAAGQAANANGGGAYEYLVTTGVPAASVGLFDAGLYAEDDWRVRPNLTLSGGLRFESQTDIDDHADLAPRVGVAWGLAHGSNTPKTVIRAGWGIFYDRFEDQYVVQARHLNGIAQTSYIVYSPDFFNPNVPVTNLSSNAQLPTIYRIAPNLRAPRTMQGAVSVERQINKATKLSVTYMNSRGDRQLLTNNINTPEPGTFPANPVYPNGIPENIFEYESAGIYRENQLIVNTNVRAGAKFMLVAYYTLGYANSDAGGANSFPSNPYNIMQDYGRAEFNVRHRGILIGSFSLPYGIRLSPFLVASSGSPYNVTMAQDFVGSTVLNQRPALATNPLDPAYVVSTPLGTFDTNVNDLGPGESIIPVNSYTGPTQFSLNLHLSKTFGFGKVSEGPSGGGGGGGGHYHHRGPGGPFGGGGGGFFSGSGADHRYNLEFSIFARNLTNYINLGPPNAILNFEQSSNPQTLTVPACSPVGVQTCDPFFGQSNSLGGGFGRSSTGAPRTFYLNLSFSF